MRHARARLRTLPARLLARFGAQVRRSRHRIIGGAVVIIAVLFIGVFPTRTYLAQKAAIARAEEQVSVLAQENERLEDRIDALNSPEEIERMARADFEMVMPGERPYVVLPAPEPAVPLPRGWPFTGLADAFPPPS
jgi:cell division protein FtsB